MISNVNFTGHEGMLNQQVKTAIESYKYLGVGQLCSKIENQAAKAVRELIDQQTIDATEYAISHGTPKDAIVGANVNTII